MEQFNFNLYHMINSFAGVNPILDKAAIIFASYMPIVFVIWLLYLWFWGGEEKRNIALFVVYAASLGLIINFIITKLYFHPRPFMLHMGKLLIPHSPETSFPSDHATFMLSIAFVAMCFRATRFAGIVLFILGIIGGTARIFCGLHFPLDVIGSLAVGLLSSLIICCLRKPLKHLNGVLIRLYKNILIKINLKKEGDKK